ncbi:hypothetical protein INR49_025549 [Caranx melampygus]|nr:hypothetical protein INR49_025549 [Caranx melampygus]
MPECDRAQPTVGLPPAAVGCTMLIFFIMFIAEVIVGAVHFSDCPRQPLIPVYMVVVGVIPLLWCCVKCSNWFSYLVSLFFTCWFIAGNVWTFSIYEPNYNKNATQVSSYCNKTLYMFAFWTNILTYVLLLGFFFSWCCSFCSQQQLSDDDPRRPLHDG